MDWVEKIFIPSTGSNFTNTSSGILFNKTINLSGQRPFHDKTFRLWALVHEGSVFHNRTLKDDKVYAFKYISCSLFGLQMFETINGELKNPKLLGPWRIWCARVKAPLLPTYRYPLLFLRFRNKVFLRLRNKVTSWNATCWNSTEYMFFLFINRYSIHHRKPYFINSSLMK